MKQILTAILVCSSCLCNAQNGAKFTQDIDSLIQQYLADHDMPSVAVGVVFQDSVLYGKRIINGSSSAHLGGDENSIYDVASVAKPLVATAIIMLVQKNELELADPVVKHLPYFKVKSKYSDDITIEQLLTHTSGLPSVSASDDYEYVKTDVSDQALENYVRSLSELALHFKPGKKYAYSNVGFDILGEIIATVSGVSFDAYMRTQLFDSLNMNRASYILSDFYKEEIAQPYIGHPYQRTKRFPYNREFSPSGNFFTSIEDMNNWMIFNLNQGQYKQFRPISEDNYDLLVTPRYDTKEDGYVGLSWFVKPTGAGKIIFHDGMDLGFSALMILFDQHKIGVLIMSNHQEMDCNELLNMVAKSIDF